MQCHDPKPFARAFTLLEAVVALSVLSIGVLGSLEGLRLCVAAEAATDRRMEALAIARDRLTQVTCTPAEWIETWRREQGIFQWSCNVRKRGHDLSIATVTVRWDSGGRKQELTLSQIFRPCQPPAKESS